MDTNLRPLTLGEILDRTAQLYRENFLLFAGIAAVYAGVLLVLSLIQIGIQEWMRVHHMVSQLLWTTGVGVLVLWIAIFIFGGLAVAANNRAVAWVHLGERATIRGAYASILPKVGRYLWLMTITTFRVWTPCAVLYLGYIVLAVYYLRLKGVFNPKAPAPAADPSAMIVFGLATIAFGFLILLALVYAVLMALRYSLAVPACVVEDLKAGDAIRRSVNLSKGTRGRIFVLGLLTIAIQVGLAVVTQMFFIVSTFKHHGLLPVGLRALQQLVAFFTNAFVGPIYATGLTLFYYDQRVRNEGFDIERMMQAAGLTTPSPEAAPDFRSAEPLLTIPVETASTAPLPEPGRLNE